MPRKIFLGQHFLTSKKIAQEIIDAAGLNFSDVVLEVGPGRGILTEKIIERVGRLIAVEKDKRLCEFLKERFVGQKKIEIVCGDILKFDPKKFHLEPGGYKIVANLPYYITSYFLRKFLQSDTQPSKMVLMVQKEVADRIIAKDGKESILSISVKVYGKVKIIKRVPKNFFKPQPKVDSAVIVIEDISKKFFKDINEKKFFAFVKRGFAKRRKLLRSNLGLDKNVFIKCGIPEDVRPENLSLNEWRCLFLTAQKNS